jgi:2-amino-4-hydroxy-6-hydroxymethyldihydropteridine diphosphokinase
MAIQTAYIGLGSNLGNRRKYIDTAFKKLSEVNRVELCRMSDFIETAALGDSSQPDYLNTVAEINTSLEPDKLHHILIEIENSLGRERKGKWAPRTIDLDLLLFGEQVVNTGILTVPHSQMHLRSFVLKGLCQLNSELIHPVMKASVGELASRLNGGDFALNSGVPQLISIAGNIGVGKTTLANKLTEYFSCDVLYEPYDTNPFLPEVYAGKNELSLDSQLYFLTRRVKQLGSDILFANQIYISDYIFDKELIYARALLDTKQFALYQDIYEPLSQNVCNPVLVIYMHDSAGKCLDRIHNRNRSYEQRIELEFLEKLAEEYEQLFNGWNNSPVIKIPTSDIDYTNTDSVEKILQQISFYITAKK